MCVPGTPEFRRECHSSRNWNDGWLWANQGVLASDSRSQQEQQVTLSAEPSPQPQLSALPKRVHESAVTSEISFQGTHMVLPLQKELFLLCKWVSRDYLVLQSGQEIPVPLRPFQCISSTLVHTFSSCQQPRGVSTSHTGVTISLAAPQCLQWR